MRARVEALFRDIIGPLLAVDGGGVELVAWEPARVTVRMTGSFGGCPSRPVVEQRLILPALRRLLGDAVEVRFEAPIPRVLSDRPPRRPAST